MPTPPKPSPPKSPVKNMYESRDRMTSEMVRDFAEEKEFTLITHTLYAYGMWLESHPDAWEHLGEPGPTNRTFARTA